MGDEHLITVCSACLRAACWQGEIMCEDARDASTVERTAAQLSELTTEDPSWWTDDG